MEAINDRLELWVEMEAETDPEVFAATVIADAEVTYPRNCAKCVGECKVY